MVYSRSVGGSDRTFDVSGLLWRDTLVMRDRETGTLWSQVSGEAIHGQDAGAALEPLPAVVTTWGDWKQAHPDTLVLRKEPLEGSPYADYFGSPAELGVTGGANPDPRLPGKEVVLGVRLKGGAVAYRLPRAGDGGVLNNDEVAGEPILIIQGPGALAPLVYSRRIRGEVVQASRLVPGSAGDDRPRFRDERGTEWDALTGEALGGTLSGEHLRPIPAFTVYWFVWSRFYPETDVR